MADWLPSERRWIDEVAERLVDGEIVVVRTIPRWGATAACATLATSLGESAVLVDGRAAAEANQKAFREEIDAKVRSAINKTGLALLLFDNYGHAIRRSQGGHLHSMLYRLLVDSSTARDTGALLTARPNGVLDPGFSGSPLISRARTVVLPVVDERDAEVLGLGLDELRSLAGDSTWLARRLLDGLRQGQVGAVEHLDHDSRRILDALTPNALRILAGSTPPEPLDTASRECLMCFGCVEPDGNFTPAKLVSESKLLNEVHLQHPTWPACLEESVERFVGLLVGAGSAIWVDRYMFSQPLRTRAFLDLVRARTSIHLRLLVSDNRDYRDFGRMIARSLEGLKNVEVRFMRWSDRRGLHDRHLVLPSLKKAYVLPTANVLLAVDEPGTAVSAQIALVDYTQYWDRASRVFPGP